MNWIAKLGQNMQFVAGCAHLFSAAYVVSHSGSHRLTVAVLIVLGAAVKEYWFDAREEHNPPQTFWLNTQDFVSWALGAGIGLLG
jgi:hypothetical protein